MERRSVLAGALALPAAVAGTAALAGCQSTGPSGGGRATLTYGYWDENQRPAMERAVAEFERANPDVRIKLALTPWSSYWTTLQTATAGGAAPDVFWMNGPSFQLYADNGALLPIDDLIGTGANRIELSRYPRPLVTMYSLGGKQYAVPKDFDTVALWYNRAMFDRAGIRYPDQSWTWQSFRSAAAELTNPRAGVYGCALEMDRQAIFYNFILQNNGYVIRDGRSGYDNEATIEALRFLTGIISAGHSPNQMAMSDTEPKDMFMSGRVAMHFDISPYAIEFSQTPYTKENADVAVLPMGRRRSTVTHGIGSVISAKTRYPDQAKRFVAFMAGQRFGQIQGASGATIPAYRGTEGGWLKFAPSFQLRNYLAELAYADQFPISANTQVWNNLEYRLLGPAFAGQADVVAAARTLATEMNAALRREKQRRGRQA